MLKPRLLLKSSPPSMTGLDTANQILILTRFISSLQSNKIRGHLLIAKPTREIMPFWGPNSNYPRPKFIQAFDFFLYFQGRRASRIVASFSRFSARSHSVSTPPPPPPPPSNAAAVWFTKVVCTLCFCYSHSLQAFFHSDYIRLNLNSNPLILFDVISHMIYKFNDPKLAFDFFQFTRFNLNVSYSFPTYNLLLRSLCPVGLYDFAKLAFDAMIVDGLFPDTSLLRFLVSSFANAGQFEIAKELLIAQARSGDEKAVAIKPFIYNDLLSLLLSKNRSNETIAFFRDHILRSQSFSPDTCSFNIVIQGLCRNGEVDTAFEFFNLMENFNCFPDIVTYNSLINGLCRIGKLDRARQLLDKIWSHQVFSPNVVTYTSIISGYCKLGKMEEASSLVDEMINYGIRPNLVTFNVLIDGFGKSGDMVSALTIYERMCTLGCPQDVVTFTSLIDAYCRTGRVDQGLKLWNELKAKKLLPNLYTFSILINALCRENRLDEACIILQQSLQRRDIVPQPFVYNPVIDRLCKSGNVDEANVIAAKMEEKGCNHDKLTFTILILGHCMKGRMSEAVSIFYKMLSVGCEPDAVIIRCLTSCLLKAGMPAEAFRIRQTEFQDLNSSVPSSSRICD